MNKLKVKRPGVAVLITCVALAGSALPRRATALSPLDGAESVVVYDANLYVAASNATAVFIYTRNPGTGLLTAPQAVQEGSACTNCLTNPTTLVVSPDGKNLYVANTNGPSAIVTFTRTLGGGLSFKQSVQRLRHAQPGAVRARTAGALSLRPGHAGSGAPLRAIARRGGTA